jgi:lysophospholipase L1-like esterase
MSGGSGGNAGASGGTGGSNAGTSGAGGNSGSGSGSGGAGGGSGTVSPVPLDPALMSRCTGSKPIKCTIPVPADGNYNVTVELGSAQAASSSQIEAELARIVVPTVKTAAGAYSQQTFSVNVHNETHDDYTAPDKVLDVVISGDAPALHGIGYAPADIPTLFVVGDSTVCDWAPDRANRGWAQELSIYLKPGLAVANYADSGESSGSFLSNSALFPAMRPLIKRNDLVLIQFGHNDKTTTAASFRRNLTSMISQVRTAGGMPILVTPPVRRLFSGSQLTGTALHVNGVGANLPAEIRGLGSSQNVPVIDLTAKSEALVESLGPTGSAQLYLRQSPDGVTDNTHFSEFGAGRMADLVVQGIRERGLSLAGYLR